MWQYLFLSAAVILGVVAFGLVLAWKENPGTSGAPGATGAVGLAGSQGPNGTDNTCCVSAYLYNIDVTNATLVFDTERLGVHQEFTLNLPTPSVLAQSNFAFALVAEFEAVAGNPGTYFVNFDPITNKYSIQSTFYNIRLSTDFTASPLSQVLGVTNPTGGPWFPEEAMDLIKMLGVPNEQCFPC